MCWIGEEPSCGVKRFRGSLGCSAWQCFCLLKSGLRIPPIEDIGSVSGAPPSTLPCNFQGFHRPPYSRTRPSACESNEPDSKRPSNAPKAALRRTINPDVSGWEREFTDAHNVDFLRCNPSESRRRLNDLIAGLACYIGEKSRFHSKCLAACKYSQLCPIHQPSNVTLRREPCSQRGNL